MSKKIPQRNVNLANKLVATALIVLNETRWITDVEKTYTPETLKNIEDQLLDAISACREFRRKPIQRNDIT